MVHKDLICYYITSVRSFACDLKLSLPKTSKYVVSFCVFATHQQLLCQIIFVFPNKFIETENIAWAFLYLERRTGKEKLIFEFHNFLWKCSNRKSIFTTNCTIQRSLIRLPRFYLREDQFENNSLHYLRWNKFYAISTVIYDNIHRSISRHLLLQFNIAHNIKGENFILN
jgi:hypothetical protein